MLAPNQAPQSSTPAFFETDINANVFPLDPLTGNRLQPGQIPESLLADPELNAGYDYLRANGSEIRAGLLLSRHITGDDLKEAGIDLAAEAKDLARQSGVLFLEDVQPTQAAKERYEGELNLVSHMPATYVERMQAVLRGTDAVVPFQAETTAQITGSGVTAASPDYVYDSDRPADLALSVWRLKVHKFEDGLEFNLNSFDEAMSLIAGYTTYRDWYLVGKMGAYLAKNPDENKSGENGSQYLKLLVGATHANIGQYLESFGALVEYKGDTPDKLSTQDARIVQAAGEAVLTNAMRIE